MSEKSRILLVEGSRTAPDYLISSLGDCFAVERVAACETALNILHANKDMISLVMLCCPMADMSLENALNHVITDPLIKHIPVVILSEDSNDGIYDFKQSTTSIGAAAPHGRG